MPLRTKHHRHVRSLSFIEHFSFSAAFTAEPAQQCVQPYLFSQLNVQESERNKQAGVCCHIYIILILDN